MTMKMLLTFSLIVAISVLPTGNNAETYVGTYVMDTEIKFGNGEDLSSLFQEEKEPTFFEKHKMAFLIILSVLQDIVELCILIAVLFFIGRCLYSCYERKRYSETMQFTEMGENLNDNTQDLEKKNHPFNDEVLLKFI